MRGGSIAKCSIVTVSYPIYPQVRLGSTVPRRILRPWTVSEIGRYRPLNGAEKWSRDHHVNYSNYFTKVEKFTDFKNAIIFEYDEKNNEVIAEKPFQYSGVTRRLAVLN